MSKRPPPSAGSLDLAGRIRERYHAPGNEHVLELSEAAREIDALCEQRVEAERERLAQEAEAFGDADDLERHAIGIELAAIIRAPAERPASAKTEWMVDPPRGSGWQMRVFGNKHAADIYAAACPPRTRIVERPAPEACVSSVPSDRASTGEQPDCGAISWHSGRAWVHPPPQRERALFDDARDRYIRQLDDENQKFMREVAGLREDFQNASDAADAANERMARLEGALRKFVALWDEADALDDDEGGRRAAECVSAAREVLAPTPNTAGPQE